MTRALDKALAANLGPFSLRNKIRNARMLINQRGQASVVTGFLSDGWYLGGNLTTHAFGVTYPSNVSKYSAANIYAQSTAVKATLAAGDYLLIGQRIEGYDVSDLLWGTALAKPIVISFTAHASHAMTITLSVRNHNGTRSYVTPVSFTTGVTTHEVVIPGDIEGTWEKGSTCGLDISWVGASGSTFTSSIINTWRAGNYIAATGNANIYDTSGKYYTIADVQIEEGTKASPLEIIPISLDLTRCQRYYERGRAHVLGNANAAGWYISSRHSFNTSKKLAPAVANLGNISYNLSGGTVGQVTAYGFTAYATAAAATSAGEWMFDFEAVTEV